MKKRLNLFALFLGLMALTCAAALAEDEPAYGFKKLSVESDYSQDIDLTPLTGNDTPATESAESAGSYPGAVKMEIVYKAAQKDSEYALFVLTDDKAPTVDNIAYIDQQTAKDEPVTFSAYPKALSASSTGADYHVYLSSNTDASAGTGIASYTKIATFSYYAAATVTLGDVNGDTSVDITDAYLVLKWFVAGLFEPGETVTDQQRVAGDVDQSGGDPDVTDAYLILRFFGLGTPFDQTG